MANTQEEVELSDSISAPSMGILPGIEERLSFKTIMFPDNPEPSTLSGFTVNICASVMGRWSYQAYVNTTVEYNKYSFSCENILVKKPTRVLISF